MRSRDKYGQIPLSRAARNGNEAAVKLLLERAVNIDSKDKYGQTPLSQNGHQAAVKLLLEKATDVNSNDIDGRTPLARAARNRHEEIRVTEGR
jgi:ankyrin repeat protein